MRILFLLVAVVAVLVLGSAWTTAATEPLTTERANKVSHPQGKKSSTKCLSARLGVAFYRGRFTSHQIQRGASIPTWRKPRNCDDARYLAEVWAKRARVSRSRTKAHLKEIAQRTLRDFAVQDGNRAWHRAVQEAQRPYPGTETWLLSCSDSEGGWGRWVPNSQGSGVGGWMQMYPSTWRTMFYGWHNNEGALSYLERKGYIVPRSAHSWYSPLGQALASAHGKLNGRGGEWHGAGC